MTFKASNLEQLIGALRLHLGDTSLTPTYSDEILHLALKYAVNALMPRWHDKYYLDADNVVQRNTYVSFEFGSPPIIQRKDERPIVLMASITLKSGKKFSESGTAISWRDEEISYSATEAGRQRDSSLNDDIKELDLLLPTRKLARPMSGRLDGFTKDWE